MFHLKYRRILALTKEIVNYIKTISNQRKEERKVIEEQITTKMTSLTPAAEGDP